MSDYAVSVATMIAIQAIAALGLNVIVGYAGQISLGHAAFFGIGAYTCAMLTTNGISFWLALPLVMLVAGVIGAVLGLPSIRLREDFLAITTIGINFIVEAVFLYTPFFGGALGIGGIPRVVFFGEKLRENGFFLLSLGFLALAVLSCWWFKRSWLGLGCFAIREDETAASSMGIPPVKFKLAAFVFGAKLAALSGALYAHYMRFISPGDFGFPVSVMFLSMVVLGGMGTLWGPILGAVVLGVLPEAFRSLMDYRMLLYGALLLLMIRFQPGGLLGEGSFVKKVLGFGRRGG
ncbi:ABC-type branched-chain amino acid transport system, permease component [Thermanaerovibrio velox DSM 12556]|uniref:ABC-type branched-chain amino acid transport system, permease component n=1 Tax=Thermanaerovibrio velox DSM 12556 TaxID=926567 RepID=H0UPB8_9BACT|nr:branched-chain amino acid ABC transporter permease [Thermanaerovibrio velox]EHM09531.1 ABC-type branched-chain amino acid transport system, permease component [Thermanaerovibrio velox DSM 12556]